MQTEQVEWSPVPPRGGALKGEDFKMGGGALNGLGGCDAFRDG